MVRPHGTARCHSDDATLAGAVDQSRADLLDSCDQRKLKSARVRGYRGDPPRPSVSRLHDFLDIPQLPRLAGSPAGRRRCGYPPALDAARGARATYVDVHIQDLEDEQWFMVGGEYQPLRYVIATRFSVRALIGGAWGARLSMGYSRWTMPLVPDVPRPPKRRRRPGM